MSLSVGHAADWGEDRQRNGRQGGKQKAEQQARWGAQGKERKAKQQNGQGKGIRVVLRWDNGVICDMPAQKVVSSPPTK